uniref:Uncharacterized LOC111223332 n=1 Tax=Seriola dumerili TaxID=41447 RepID=A0A3B4T9B3_SERDU
MNLWFSSLTLVAGLFLCSTALPLEECQTLVTPSSLADPSTMYGRLNVLVGYTDHEAFNGILKVTDSSWLKISPTSSPNKIVMSEDNKICFCLNLHCFHFPAAYLPSIANITSVFHLVPSCDGCVVFSINTTASNLDHFFKLLNMTKKITDSESKTFINFVFLPPGKESTVKDSDMEHFKKQASCFGFDREPDFVYDTKKGASSVNLPADTGISR